MVQVSPCARFAMLAHQVVNVVSRACSFTSKEHNPRNDIKNSSGSARDSTTELDRGACADENDGEHDGGPGSDDEDVLTSLGASYRAWRVYHREKKAHDYTKSRLVESIRREATLAKQMARFDGSVEQIERAFMRQEDLEATVIILVEKYDTVVTRQATENDNELDLESQCPLRIHRLHEADALHWKTQCEQLLSELASINLEKNRLIEELRKAKKTAVLIMNRQYVHLETGMSSAPQLLPRAARRQKNDIKKRSYSDIAIVQD
ncbi:unnamed protein product [Peronospora farinosa]|uniref:Uncharacterized protein n=1 Tax=Peronospora farinosa TaxID=134698 RepID=A0AAV0U8G5_9STRA|nr:unnamed protein product [Peronospora farinosa]CAI5732927.1 unnamed protein product [Peronospora farinosa]